MDSNVYYGEVLDEFLEHHGIKGMKWGIRRFQNPDGSLTPAGRERRGLKSASAQFKRGVKGIRKDINSNVKKAKKQLKKVTKKFDKKPEVRSEEEKKRAIKNGDFKTLAKYMDELTIDELREADARLNLMTNMNRNYSAMHPKAKPFLSKVADTANSLGDAAQGIKKIATALDLDAKSRKQLMALEKGIEKQEAEIKKIKAETKKVNEKKPDSSDVDKKEEKALDQAKAKINEFVDSDPGTKEHTPGNAYGIKSEKGGTREKSESTDDFIKRLSGVGNVFSDTDGSSSKSDYAYQNTLSKLANQAVSSRNSSNNITPKGYERQADMLSRVASQYESERNGTAKNTSKFYTQSVPKSDPLDSISRGAYVWDPVKQKFVRA